MWVRSGCRHQWGHSILKNGSAKSGARVFWILVAIAILAGIFFRLEHVERRKVKADESVTALRVSGHTLAEVRTLFDGRTYSLEQILRFQRVDPSEPMTATVTGLADEEPQITPLFYVLDREWAQVAGSSIASLRIPALLFGVAAIAAMFWFCFELTEDVVVAGAGAALMALSPFFVTYGGQARQYSLWVALIAVSSALLLRAVRNNKPRAWIWYGVAIALALYTDLLSLFVLAGHAAYVLLWYRRDRARAVSFGIAAAGAIVAFVPWIVIAATGHHAIAKDLGWTDTSVTLRAWAKQWYFNVASVLFDAEFNNKWLAPVAAVAAIFLAYACYRVQRDESRQTASFLATLAIPITVAALALDIVTHGHGSTVARYLIPLWFAVLASVAIFLGRKLILNGRLHASWFAAFCVVLAITTVSTAINSSASAWWDNHDIPSAFIARTVSAGDSPLVMAGLNPNPVVLEMSHYFPPSTTFLLFASAPPFPLPSGHTDFLLIPSPATLDAFRVHPGYSLQRVPFPSDWNDYGLFRVSSK